MTKQQNLPCPSPLASEHAKIMISNLIIATVYLVLEVCVMEIADCYSALR